jgi:hypothetical protein
MMEIKIKTKIMQQINKSGKQKKENKNTIILLFLASANKSGTDHPVVSFRWLLYTVSSS